MFHVSLLHYYHYDIITFLQVCININVITKKSSDIYASHSVSHEKSLIMI